MKKHFNFLEGTLSAALTTAGTTMTSVALADLETISGEEYIAVTIGNSEIVHITAHTSGQDTATITRAQEGTTASAHAIGTEWEHTLTADDLNTFGHAVFESDQNPTVRINARPTGSDTAALRIYTENGEANRYRFGVENNLDDQLIDINMRNANVNIGDSDAANSLAGTSLRILQPSGATSNPVTLYKRASQSLKVAILTYLGRLKLNVGGVDTRALEVNSPEYDAAGYEPYFAISSAGEIGWGPGGTASALDVTISRTGVGQLQLSTGDSFVAGDGSQFASRDWVNNNVVGGASLGYTMTDAATGNTATDYTALGAAVTAAGTYGMVWIPSGEYVIGTTWTIATTGVRIHGPRDAIIRLSTDADDVIEVTADHVEIRGITIEGTISGAYNTNDGSTLRVTGDNCIIEDVAIRNSPKHGIYGLNSSNLTIRKCRIARKEDGTGDSTLNNGIFVEATTGDMVGPTIIDNYIDRSDQTINGTDATGGGIKIHGTKHANETQRIQFTNVDGGTWDLVFNGQTSSSLAWDISTASLQAAMIADLSNVNSGDVYVSGGSGSWTISFHGQYEAPSGTNPALITTVNTNLTGSGKSVAVTVQTAFDATYYELDNTRIIGNYVKTAVNPSSGTGGIAIETWGGCPNSIVKDNVTINGSMGISLDWSDGSVCMGNTIYAPIGGDVGDGLGIECAGSSYCTISNNVIDGGDVSSEGGILVWDAGSYYVSQNNTIQGNVVKNMAPDVYGVVVQTSQKAIDVNPKGPGGGHIIADNVIYLDAGGSSQGIRYLRAVDSMFRGNRVKMSGHTATGSYAIYLQSSGYAIVQGNFLEGQSSYVDGVYCNQGSTMDGVAVIGNTFKNLRSTLKQSSTTIFGTGCRYNNNLGNVSGNYSTTTSARYPAAVDNIDDLASYVSRRQGTGVPAHTAPVGSTWIATDGGSTTTLYVKESGTGSSGWTAK